MGTGYTRNDTGNNIADGNIISASDIDGEYDAIESAFNESTGHTHDGTAAEGAPITVLGPVQDFIASATEIKPKTTNTLDIGTVSLQFKDMYLDGTAYIDGLGEDILVATDKKVQFRDTALFINSSVDGQLDIDADVELELVAPTVDIDASTAVTIDTATLTITGSANVVGDLDVDNININGNTISSTDTNGNITLAPNGTGVVALSSTDLTFGNNDKAIFGAGSDLQIYHNGSDSYIIDDGTGNLNLRASSQIKIQSLLGEDCAIFNENGSSSLQYDNATKLATTATGIDVTGTAVTDGLTVAGNVSLDGGTIKLDGNYPVGTENVALGNTALDDGSLSGSFNTAIGNAALSANTSGSQNVAVGRTSLTANSTGGDNTAVGMQALQQNATGSNNTGIGSQALLLNTASNNTAVGYQSLYANTTGTGHAAVGSGALKGVTTGNNNTAIGKDAAQAVTTGSAVVAVGRAALYTNTTGNYNTALGETALYSNTTASENTAVGYESLYDNSTGARNTAVGHLTLFNNTTASDNTAMGREAMYYNTTGAENSAFGSGALVTNTTGSYNTALGRYALVSNTTANNNTAVGYRAGYSNTTGAGNVFMGYDCGYNTTTGGLNVAIGHDALNSNTTSSRNTAIGYNALHSANPGAVDAENVAVGLNTGFALTTGTQNTFLGTYAGNVATTGTYNTFIGRSSGNAITTGSKNTILGSYSGNQGGLDIRTSSNNIVLSDGDGNPRVHVASGGRVGVNYINPNSMLAVNSSSSYTGNSQLTNFVDAENRVGNYRYNSNASFSSTLTLMYAARSNNTAYNFMQMGSGGAGDTEFSFRGDGEAYADGSWNGGGADYAEYFEWSDGNVSNEDRRGYSVVLDGDKIRLATDDDAATSIIGVISGNPSVVGDTDIGAWKSKYLKDDFGAYVRDENDERVLNPDYNEEQEYVSREDRNEWDVVGLMGKLRIRKGQPVGERWIKMRDISDSVEEWLVR